MLKPIPPYLKNPNQFDSESVELLPHTVGRPGCRRSDGKHLPSETPVSARQTCITVLLLTLKAQGPTCTYIYGWNSCAPVLSSEFSYSEVIFKAAGEGATAGSKDEMETLSFLSLTPTPLFVFQLKTESHCVIQLASSSV